MHPHDERVPPPAPADIIDLSEEPSDDDPPQDSGKRKRSQSQEASRPRRLRLPSVVVLSPLDPEYLTPPNTDFAELLRYLESALVEPHVPGYALYALGIRDTARRSTRQLLRPRQIAEHFADHLQLFVPAAVLAKIHKVVDLVAACIWGRLPHRPIYLPGRPQTSSDFIRVSESVALSAIVDIGIQLADMLWGQHTPYSVQVGREDLFEPGFDDPPTLYLGEAGLGDNEICSICRQVKSYSVLRCSTAPRFRITLNGSGFASSSDQLSTSPVSGELGKAFASRSHDGVTSSSPANYQRESEMPSLSSLGAKKKSPRYDRRIGSITNTGLGTSSSFMLCMKGSTHFILGIAKGLPVGVNYQNSTFALGDYERDVTQKSCSAPPPFGATTLGNPLLSLPSTVWTSLPRMASTSPPSPLASPERKPVPESTLVARRRASAKFRQRNIDNERAKARERMARRRAHRRADPVLREEDRARAQETNRAYREKNSDRLAEYDRNRRALAYTKKYGLNAYVEREAQRRQLAQAAAEEQYLDELEQRAEREAEERRRGKTKERARGKKGLHQELAEEDEEREAIGRGDCQLSPFVYGTTEY
ncbi:hypothetical protein C8F01DRAFT_1084362 [Mycena amicta]|nr:hypothetical protein C8F01DRAFT_1084362 [Mycena amicta]